MERDAMSHRLLFTLLLVPMLSACAAGQRVAVPETPQDRFWASLETLCGRAFEGTITLSNAGDSGFVGQRMVMHVRRCGEDQILVPFHVGENRSRTWVFTRTEGGLRLKHDHRHEDGSADPITQYGGDTAAPGTASRQEFLADAHTAALIPAAATNIWTVEIEPGGSFAYGLRREGTERRFRVQFDLARPVAAPPAPWGHE